MSSIIIDVIIIIIFANNNITYGGKKKDVVESFIDDEEEEPEIVFIDLSDKADSKEAKADSKPKEAKADSKPKEAKADVKPKEAKADTKEERIKVLEKQHAELKALLLKNKKAEETVLQKERVLVKEQNTVATAVAKAILNGDSVSHINILDAGGNYTGPPTIMFSGGEGSGAKALAKIRDGHVVAIELTSGGKGYTSPPKIVFNREAFCGTNPVETVNTIKSKATAFNKIQNEHVKDIQNRVKEAEKQWAPMLKTINEDKKIAEEAKSIGFPPPPPLYTPEEIKAVQKELNLKPRKMTEKEKAKCMDLSNETKKVVESLEFLSTQGIDIPALRPAAQNKAELLEKLKAEYKNKCA